LKIFLRHITRVIAGAVLLLIIVWMILWAYLSLNKKNIEAKIRTALEKKMNASIFIDNMEISWLRTFPYISLELNQVLVRDSLWNNHKHDLLRVARIFGEINPLKLLFGGSPVNKLLIEDGKIYLFTDSLGYSNINIFRNQDRSADKGNEDYPEIAGKNIELVIEKTIGHKLFEVEIRQLTSKIKKENNILYFDANIHAQVHNMTFNPNNGSFLRNKEVKGSCLVEYGLKDKILAFNQITLDIDGHPFLLSGKFFTRLNPAPFEIALETKSIPYRQAVSFLSNNVQRTLNEYDLDKPVDLTATLDGSNPLPRSPVIHLHIQVADAMVTTPFEVFSHCSFQGAYINQEITADPPADENSVFRIHDFSGSTEDIPLSCDSIIFANLIHPQLTCNLRSHFQLTSLNNLLDSRNIEFGKGQAQLNIVYSGPIKNGDSINADINGEVTFDSASIKYLPKNFLLNACSGKLQFLDKDLLITELKAQVGSTQLKMDGGIKSLVTLIDKSPEKLNLYWNIFSPTLNLRDFRSFMGRTPVSAKTGKSKRFFTKQVSQIDSLLNSCDVRLLIKANEILYGKFAASNLNAGLDLNNNIIRFDSVSMNLAGGSLGFTGLLKSQEMNNMLEIHATVKNADIDKILFSFEDFGQDAISAKNIRGKLTATVDLLGAMNAEQQIIPSTIDGSFAFSLKKGELIDYEPVQIISKKVFKDRDFSDIRFAELKDRFELRGSAIKINRMEIESTAITLFVEGIYDTKKGTDMSIQVPLSNLKSRKEDSIPSNKGINSATGFSARLRARTGDDRKLKVTWDPFKKALKNMKKTEQENSSR
jgi:hypothetical protein